MKKLCIYSKELKDKGEYIEINRKERSIIIYDRGIISDYITDIIAFSFLPYKIVIYQKYIYEIDFIHNKSVFIDGVYRGIINAG